MQASPMAPEAQLGAVVPVLRELVAGTRPDQLDAPTPCARWAVRDLLSHLVTGATMFAGALRGAPTYDIADPPDAVGDDPLGAFDRAAGAFGAAIGDTPAHPARVETAFGPLAVPALLELLAFDLAVHAWDLGRATGQPVPLPDDVVAAATATAAAVLTDGVRDGETFAAPTTAPPGASALDRLAAMAGRST